jgi:hypothetical protein
VIQKSAHRLARVVPENEGNVLRKVTIKTIGSHQDLVREGNRPQECGLIAEELE